MGLSAAFPAIIGTILLSVAVWRAGVAPGWTALLVTAGWLVPFGSEVSLILSVAGAGLMTLGFGWTGLAVARMDDQTWAERAFVRTSLVKAPKIAAESAA